MLRLLLSVGAALALASGAAGAQTTPTAAPVTPLIVTPGEPAEDYIVARQTFVESCTISINVDGVIVVTGTGIRNHTVTVWASGLWTDTYTKCIRMVNARVTEDR